ncbi:MAG: phage tail tape measure protein [Bacteroidales bacterium]|nr:phage tail tape measure protein [Bacteroidales bacterium]
MDIALGNLAAQGISKSVNGLKNLVSGAIETGMAFDSSMSQVAATMGVTVDEIQELRDFAQEMGSTTAFSATEAADALNYMALAGYDANTSMEMLPNVLNLAAAGGMELAAASDMVTDTQTALGLSLEETNALVDQMAKTASSSNTSVSQLGDALLTVGGTAKELPGGINEMNAVLGVLADNGIKGSEAGTHLRNMILSLEAPTDTAAAALNDLGVSVFDAQGDMRSLQDIMSELNVSMEDMTAGEKTEIISTIFNKTDIASVNALLATTEERWDELGTAIEDSTGAAQQMADTQLDNLSGDVTILKSAWEGLQIALSDLASGTMRDIVQQVTELVGGLTGLINGTVSAAEFTEILSDTLSTLLGTVIDVLVEGIPVLIEGATILFTAILEALPPIIVQLAEALPELIDTVVTTLLDNLPTLLDAAVTFFLAIVDSIPTIIDALVAALPMVIDSIVSFFTSEGGIAKLMNANIQLFMGLVQAIPTIVVNLVAALPEILAAIVSTLAEWVGDIFNSALEIGGAIIDGIKQGITNLWSSFTSFISDTFNGIVDSVKGFFGISSPSTVFAEIGENMIEGMEGGISNEAGALEAQTQASTSGVVSAANTALAALPGSYTGAANAASAALTSFMASSVTPEQQANVKALVEALGKTAEETILAENSSGVGFFATGVAAGQGFIDGLESKRSAIMALAREIADEVRRTIEDALDIHSPSGVFRDIGMNTAEGLALGIEEGAAAYLPGAMEDMLSEVGYSDSAIGSLESTYGNMTAATINATNSNNSQPRTLRTVIQLGGATVGEQIYKLYNDRLEVIGQGSLA